MKLVLKYASLLIMIFVSCVQTLHKNDHFINITAIKFIKKACHLNGINIFTLGLIAEIYWIVRSSYQIIR